MDLEYIQRLVKGYENTNNLIYNKYQRSDFNVGADNLNPVRELDITDDQRDRLDDLKVQLYLAYKERLELLKDAGVDNNITPADLGLPYVDKVQVSSPITMQESSQSIAEPSLEDDVVGLLGALGSLLGDGEALEMADLPYDLCGDRGGGPFGDGGFGSSGDGEGSGGADPGSLGDSGGSGGSSSDGIGSGLMADNPDAIKCLQMELVLLYILLVLIGIITGIMMVQQIVMAIIFPIMNIVSMIAQAWINPAIIGKLIQQLATTGMAFVMEVILMVIQTIIDSLNLDCLISGPIKAIQTVMGQVSGVQDAGSELKTFVDFNNPDSPLYASVQSVSKVAEQFQEGPSLGESLQNILDESVAGAEAGITQGAAEIEAAATSEVESTAGDVVRISKQAEATVKDFFGDGFETN